MQRTPRSIADYDALFDPVRKAREEKSGKQLGDPVRAARAILAIIQAEAPPTHLLLGSDALHLVRSKLADLTHNLDLWEEVTISTDMSSLHSPNRKNSSVGNDPR
jgi:hypothetical protein